MTRGRSGLNVAGSVFQGAFQLTVNWRGDIRPNARASFHPSDLGGQRDTKVTRKDTKTQQDSLPRLSDERNNTVASRVKSVGSPSGTTKNAKIRRDGFPPKTFVFLCVLCGFKFSQPRQLAKRTVLCLLRCGDGPCCVFVCRAKRSRRALVTRLGEKNLKIFFRSPFPVPRSLRFHPIKSGFSIKQSPNRTSEQFFPTPIDTRTGYMLYLRVTRVNSHLNKREFL